MLLHIGQEAGWFFAEFCSEVVVFRRIFPAISVDVLRGKACFMIVTNIMSTDLVVLIYEIRLGSPIFIFLWGFWDEGWQNIILRFEDYTCPTR